MFRSRPLSLAILLAVAPLSASAGERADLLIRNATVVDVEHASTRAGQSVVIRGEDIVAVGPDAQLRSQWSAARQIDAKGKYLIVEDADLELDIGAIVKMLEIIENDPSIDMVNGRRILKKGKKSGLVQNLARVITSVFAKILYGKYLNDLLCSYKLCLVSKFKRLNLKSTRFGLETEWIIKALKKQWKIVEIDVLFSPRLHKQGKKINFFDGFDIVWQLIKYRFTN